MSEATRTLGSDRRSIEVAADWLRSGRVVAFPTETVYGLGASTFDERAIREVYRLKGRPSDNPLIAHVARIEQVDRLASLDEATRPRLEALAARFWPGPLTVVLPRRAEVPAAAAGGRGSIAVRVPAHPIARSLLEAFGSPISAPSANRSGHVSATSAAHVLADFPREPGLLVLDGGSCPVGVESTVLDLTSTPPRILRPGTVDAAALGAVLGRVDAPTVRGQAASPGTAERHYSPRTASSLLSTSDLRAAVRQAVDRCAVLAISLLEVPPPHVMIRMPSEATPYAARLYAALREADQTGSARILIERPTETTGSWPAILDRLARATSLT